MPARERYTPLKNFVRRNGGIRVAAHGALRDQLIDWAVEEFPIDAPDDRKEEVLAARLRVRGREYGSIVLSILLGVMINLIVHYIVEWWKRHHSHQVLMEGWQRAAKNPDVPPPPKAA